MQSPTVGRSSKAFSLKWLFLALIALSLAFTGKTAWTDEFTLNPQQKTTVENENQPHSEQPSSELQQQQGTSFRRHLYTSPTIAISSIHYKEGSIRYSAITLSGKVSTRYALSPRWDLGGSAHLTLLPVQQTSGGNTARFLGVNARVGYSPEFPPSPWRLSILTGLYYTRMIVSNDAFGFTDMVGPQLFPVLARRFSQGDSAMIYLKLSPVTNKLSLLSLSNREMAAGFTFAHLTQQERVITFSLDYANMALEFTGVKVLANTISLGAGLHF